MSKYGDDTRIKTSSGLVYSELGLANDGALTTLVGTINTHASALIDAYCGRDFTSHADDIIYQHGTNSPKMLLPGRPIVSISYIKADTVTVDASTYRIGRIPGSSLNSGTVERTQGWWYRTTDYEVKYTWGFSSTPAEVVRVAEDIALLILRDIRERYITGNASSTSMGGFSSSIMDHHPVVREALQYLDQYRMVVLG